MGRKLASLLILLLVAVSAVHSIGFGYHVIEARSDVDFAGGIFPIAVNYQFNFPVPDLLPGSMTELAFRLDNGLDFRTLRQNPKTGDFYALSGGVDYSLDYMVVYDEFNLFFNQGFWNDHLTLGVSIDGRFENAYESLEYLSNPDGNALFTLPDGSARFKSFIGAPELEGSRSIFQTYLSGLLAIDFMDDEAVRRNGARLTSDFRITGPWMPMNDSSGDFLISSNTLDLSLTLFHLERGSGKSWISLVLDNSTTYRFIWGDKVPVYIEGGVLFDDVAAPATRHVVTNELALTIYGPQFTVDTYPSVSLFWDFGYSFGPALNSVADTTYGETVSVWGVKVEFLVLDIFKVYWHWGYVVDPVFNEQSRAITRLGFTFGV